jgi:hypothetical protein
MDENLRSRLRMTYEEAVAAGCRVLITGRLSGSGTITGAVCFFKDGRVTHDPDCPNATPASPPRP